MENSKFIEFKKTRDLGAIITDTFKFLRDNWKAYFSMVLKIAGPAMIVLIICLGLYVRSLGGMFESLAIQDAPNLGFDVFLYIFIAAIAGLVFYVLLQMSSLYFIKSYINNGGEVNKQEVIDNVKQHFWKFVGLGILTMLITFAGIMLCVLPGIYVAIVLSLATSIMVFEGKGVGDTISHCFTLIKDHWFETFGVVFVVGLLVSFLGGIFSIPSIIYQFATMMTQVGQEDPTAVLSLFSDPIYLILTALSYVGRFLLSSITLISTVFIYYDLNEQKNLTGTLEKIDKLGTAE